MFICPPETVLAVGPPPKAAGNPPPIARSKMMKNGWSTALAQVVASTTVEFRAVTAAEIERYVASGEPMDKAGAYAIQGGAGDFVTRIDGDYDNVVGLPVALIQAMCLRLGIQVS